MKTLLKRDVEQRSYIFDFSTEPEIVGTDTIASVTSISSGAGSSSGAVPTLGTGTINAAKTQVSCVISGGVTGNNYLLRCVVLTTDGSTLERLGILAVNNN